jgi:hypothetical protein
LALDLKVLPVEHIHQLIRILKAEAHKRDPTQAHGTALHYIVYRPAGPIRLQVMAQQRSGCIWKAGLIHADRAPSGSGFSMAEAGL